MHRRTHTKSKEHKDKQRTHTEAGRRKKTVEHSNDYAPDLLTPYFIITVEKKHSTIDLPHCFLFSLSLSLTHSPTPAFTPALTSLFLLLSHSQKFASATRLY